MPEVLDLTEELNAEIEKIAAEAGITKEEVFERALRLLKVSPPKEAKIRLTD